MLLTPGLSSYGFTFDNWGANPTLAPGTSVVPGASNVEGSWTQVAANTDIARDVHWFAVLVAGGALSANVKDHLVDIGVDPAGGTSYTAVISNIVCGGTATYSTGGPQRFLFPLYIKAGSSVAVRAQGSNATAGTLTISLKFWGDPANPENIPVGQYSETIGTITNSGGVSFTPGNAADGAWVSLGTTVKEMWWWQVAAQVSNATVNLRRTYVEIAYGDATNKVSILKDMFVSNTTEENTAVLGTNVCWMSCYVYVPAATNIYVRGRCNAAPDTGWNAVAVGIGG